MKDKIVLSLAAGLFLVIFVVLISVQTQEEHSYGITNFTVEQQDNGVLHWFTIGDFGTKEYNYENKTSIQAVADVMTQVRRESDLPLQFVMSVGDNRYQEGPEGIFDHFIYEMMTDIYAGTTDVPWYLALGNHDCRTSLETSIELSNIYEAWNMPAPYYNVTIPIDDNTKASFLYVNACNLFCVPWEEGFDHKCTRIWDYESTKEKWQEQMNWIEETLASQQNDTSIAWRFVVSHYPIWNVGKHGDNPSMKENLFPLLSKYGVDVFFAGHEHNQQFYRVVPFANVTEQTPDLLDCVESHYPNGKELVTKKGEHIHEVLMGASGYGLGQICKARLTPMASLEYGLKQYGFCDIALYPDRMNILYYSVDNGGEIAYNVTILN